MRLLFVPQIAHQMIPTPTTFRTLLLFLLLTFSISEISAGGSGAAAPVPVLTPTKCSVCDSQTQPTCSDDSELLAGHNFTMECELPKIWCYKSEGNITTKDHTGHSISLMKVERGCTKARNREECVRVVQKDESDFKVCFCRNETCNIDYDISVLVPINPNGAADVLAGSTLRNVWLLLFMAFAVHLVDSPR